MKMIKSALLGTALLTLATTIASAADNRSYVAGHFILNLDSANTGLLNTVSGGGVSADVLQEQDGTTYFAKKHIGQPKYEDFSMDVGFGMSKPFYDWISDAFDGKATRKNGAIIMADYNFAELQRATFQNALIGEVTIPACDGSAKDAAYLTVKFLPELTKWVPSNGTKTTSALGNAKQKLWVPSNFRLEIPGLDCTRVSKIEAITVKQKIVENSVGQARNYQIEPTSLEFPNLVITLSTASASAWTAWSDDFIVAGKNTFDFEKKGTLTLLSPDLKEELARVSLFGLGISRLTRSLATGVPTITVELYVERMEIDFMAQFEKN
ncbi:MAG TPA: phage tail protein [Verrucomicrobiae bacterium]|nr:phage tail protein [Verrucomicrobiae bacterium]